MNRKKPKKQAKPTLKQDGRPRISFPIIDGMQATSARLGCPPALLKSLKNKGSKAFLTGNRVDTGILIPELFAALEQGSKLPPGIATPQDWVATENAKIKAIHRETLEKSLMPVASAVKQAGEAMGYTFAELERRDRELPPALAGLSAVEIGKRMSADTESIRKTLNEKFELIPE